MRKETYFVKDECENGMGRDPQEMSSGTCDPTMSVWGGRKERKKKNQSPLYHPAIPSALNVFQRQSNGFV